MTSNQITQNSILRISDQKTLQFLELYQKEECLWNTKINEYRIKLKRKEAAERVAKKFNVPHFNAKHVIMKFRNLRSSYTQELKKIASSEAAGEDPLYRPKVFWFSKIEFVRPHLQLYKASKPPPGAKMSEEENDMYLEVKTECDDSFCYEDNEESYEPSEKRSRSLLTPRGSFEGDNDSDMSDPLEEDSHPPITSQEERYENADRYVNVLNNMLQPEVKPGECFNNCVQYAPSTTDAPRTKEQRLDNCFDSFGIYVAAMLKSMPVQRAMALKPEIVKLLVSATLDTNEAPSNQSDYSENL